MIDIIFTRLETLSYFLTYTYFHSKKYQIHTKLIMAFTYFLFDLKLSKYREKKSADMEWHSGLSRMSAQGLYKA